MSKVVIMITFKGLIKVRLWPSRVLDTYIRFNVSLSASRTFDMFDI